jgi:hypothetical protein
MRRESHGRCGTRGNAPSAAPRRPSSMLACLSADCCRYACCGLLVMLSQSTYDCSRVLAAGQLHNQDALDSDDSAADFTSACPPCSSGLCWLSVLPAGGELLSRRHTI